MIKIILTDDQQIYLDALRMVLKTEDDIEVVAEANDGLQLLELLKINNADAVLLDINMPKMNGIEASTIIRKKYPDIKIVMLTMHKEINMIKKLLDIGVHAYLLKNTSKVEIVRVLKKVIDGGTYYGEEVKDVIIDSFVEMGMNRNIQLTKLEKEILSLICAGNSNRQLVKALGKDINEVFQAKISLFEKVGVDDNTSLVRYAYENNLIEFNL
jgi:DNA-binding NarL/FixJ family response regulator